MGYAIAEAASARGARVVLVSGPTELSAPKGCEVIRVRGALEMHKTVIERAEDLDAVVMAAAVADFRPSTKSECKLKKGADEKERVIKLVRNPDILKELGERLKGQKKLVLVGFAVETEDLVSSAKKKLKSKKATIMVANLADHGFQGKDNQATILDDKGRVEETGQLSKRELATRIVDLIKERIGG
jgi:phosphopantothenoylcysteine decarboxylase/phosphopantothenate--cysteine ligase